MLNRQGSINITSESERSKPCAGVGDGEDGSHALGLEYVLGDKIASLLGSVTQQTTLRAHLLPGTVPVVGRRNE